MCRPEEGQLRKPRGPQQPVEDVLDEETRDYRHDESTITSTQPVSTGERLDRIHTARVRLDVPLVRYVVARLPITMPGSLDRDDFYSVGVIGLMHAATTYDPSVVQPGAGHFPWLDDP